MSLWLGDARKSCSLSASAASASRRALTTFTVAKDEITAPSASRITEGATRTGKRSPSSVFSKVACMAACSSGGQYGCGGPAPTNPSRLKPVIAHSAGFTFVYTGRAKPGYTMVNADTWRDPDFHWQQRGAQGGRRGRSRRRRRYRRLDGIGVAVVAVVGILSWWLHAAALPRPRRSEPPAGAIRVATQCG